MIISSDIGAIAYMAKSHDFVDVVGITSREPVMAIRRNQWGEFLQTLMSMKPQWVAESGTPEGKISSFEIVADPYRIFRGKGQNDKPNINMYSPQNKTVLQISTKDGYVFRLVKIDATIYN